MSQYVLWMTHGLTYMYRPLHAFSNSRKDLFCAAATLKGVLSATGKYLRRWYKWLIPQVFLQISSEIQNGHAFLFCQKLTIWSTTHLKPLHHFSFYVQFHCRCYSSALSSNKVHSFSKLLVSFFGFTGWYTRLVPLLWNIDAKYVRKPTPGFQAKKMKYKSRYYL